MRTDHFVMVSSHGLVVGCAYRHMQVGQGIYAILLLVVVDNVDSGLQ